MSEKRFLFETIIDDLTNQIARGQYAVGDKLPTEMELAQQYHVSRITSKRALEELERSKLIYRQQGSGSFVGSDPSLAGRPPASEVGAMRLAALVMPFTGIAGNAVNITSALSSELGRNGIYLTIHNSHHDEREERRILSTLIADQVKSVFLYPVSQSANLDLLYKMKLMGTHIVAIDHFAEAFGVDCITSDNFTGGLLATEHLIALGHRKICFLSDRDPGSATSSRDRYMGFNNALWQHGLDFSEKNLCLMPSHDIYGFDLRGAEYEAWIENGKILFDKIFDAIPGCTAVFAMYDYLAIYLMKIAGTLGMQVPRDLSIIGFGNIEQCAYSEVPLTTIAMDYDETGKAAAQCMLAKLAGTPDAFAKDSSVIPVSLVTRMSCQSPAQP